MALTLGRIRELDPDLSSLDDSQLVRYLHETYDPESSPKDFYSLIGYEDPNAEGDIARGFKNTFRQAPQLAYGIEAAAGATLEHAFGEGGIGTGIKQHGLKNYLEESQNLAEHSKESDSLTYSWDKAKQGDFNALVDWMQYGLGYGGGQALQMLATGFLGGAAAKLTARQAAATLTERMVQSEAAKIAAREGAQTLTADAIKAAAVANVTQKIGNIGAATAVGAAAYGMEGGEIGGDLVAKAEQEGRKLTGDDLMKGFGATVMSGSLEFVGDLLGLGALTGKIKIPGITGRVAQGAATGTVIGASEGTQEYGQTLLEEWGKGNDPFSEESRRQAIDAAGLGAIAGAGMGGVGGIVSGGTTAKQRDIPDTSGSELGPINAPQQQSPLDGVQDIANAGSVDEAINAMGQALNEPLTQSEAIQQGLNNESAASSVNGVGNTAQGAGAGVNAELRVNEGGLLPVAGSRTNIIADNQQPATEKFVPTHELSDSTPVINLNGNTYRDAQGDEYQDDYATPLQPIAQPIGINDRLEPVTSNGSVNGNDNNLPESQQGPVSSGVGGEYTGPSALTNTEIDQAAHEAAASPLNDLPQPTDAQKEAGNYKKGHIANFHGLDITIENPAGSTRSGVDQDGNPWSVDMAHHYGYIKKSTGADNEHIDVFIGHKPESTKAFVVNQIDPKTGDFDEHKVLLGFDNKTQARLGYLKNYSKGWKGLGSITEVPIDELKNQIDSGAIRKPIHNRTTEHEQPITEAGTTPTTEAVNQPEPGTPVKPVDAGEEGGVFETGDIKQAQVITDKSGFTERLKRKGIAVDGNNDSWKVVQSIDGESFVIEKTDSEGNRITIGQPQNKWSLQQAQDEIIKRSWFPEESTQTNEQQDIDLSVNPKSVTARKQKKGEWKLFHAGSDNEVYPGKTFNSISEAKKFNADLYRDKQKLEHDKSQNQAEKERQDEETIKQRFDAIPRDFLDSIEMEVEVGGEKETLPVGDLIDHVREMIGNYRNFIDCLTT